MNFISLDESASNLIQVVDRTRFLVILGLRSPFLAGSLALLPEVAHIPSQAFLVAPHML